MEKTGGFGKALGAILSALCVIVSLFHIYVSYSTGITMVQQRIIHVFFILLIFFLSQTVKALRASKSKLIVNLVFSIAITGVGVYFVNGSTLSALSARGISGASQADIVIGVLLTLAILYVSFRTVGWALTALSLIFIAYAMLGPYMPDLIAHKGYKVPYITSYLAWTSEAIFGSTIGASVSFVALYIIFGELLNNFGAGQFFIDIAYVLTGRMKGGPAEAAVVSSALMGSINGSAVANVVTTGTFTIPLMKKVGYRPAFAGAVEAVASTGGQLLPPVMGAAAFVMADVTGIPYATIILAALVPGLLYYLSLGVAVYLEADKRNLDKEDASRLPRIKQVLKEGWYHAIPILVLLVALLGLGLSANYAAIFAIIALLAVGIIKAALTERRFPLKEIVESLISGAKTAVPVAIACACAGIVIGIVSMTGIGVKFTSIVFEASGGNLFMMLVMIMVACIVMGMGLPSTAAYIIAASIGAPALIKAGIPDLAAHLFVFYFAIISFITPPVAMAAYAASGIAKSKTSETGWLAFMLGLPGFIIPFIYAYRPAMLLVGAAPLQAIWVVACSTLAVVLMAVAVIGWLRRRLNALERLLLGAAAAFLIFPALWCDITGLTLAAVMLAYVLFLGKKPERSQGAAPGL
ncbi:MAG: TRAP transporter permease [Candidatus Limiplasma sp.]|nr:TRAP transporter permease [Candidatus Limiplasma sp.]